MSVSFLPNTITIILTANSPNYPPQIGPTEILKSIYGINSGVGSSSTLKNNLKNNLNNDLNNNVVNKMNDNSKINNNLNNNINNNLNSNINNNLNSISIHGRELKEWNLKALRNRINYFSQTEIDLILPAGL